MEKQSLKGLNSEELIHGMRLCLVNATELYGDAETLRSADRLTRAYTLYQLAIEEIGKIQLLYSLFYDLKLNVDVNYKKIDENFVHHPTKTKQSIRFEEILVIMMNHKEKNKNKRKELKQYIKELANQENKTKEYNYFKNLSLYVSISDGAFVLPQDIITQELVEPIRTSAFLRLKSLTILMELIIDEDVVRSVEKISNDPNYHPSIDIVDLYH